ncbi:GPW/gp25 family protein [Wohlfahrtiimonas larvae]|uniref:GPW/gp25 family protein n=1 Tax=Wohlfahrtiimonas larvae TaxID=1157986 RepID=A0ABP9MNV5_9GAMM
MMNRETGVNITRNEHIQQSILDILTTRLGTRVMRRDYGSLLPDLVDKPSNDETMMQMMSATVIALAVWEPRITATFVNFTETTMQGVLNIELEATIKESNEMFSMNQQLFSNPEAMNNVIKKGGING